MSTGTTEAYADRRFYRSADRALLGGVCAGLADYFGFNLRVLRFMAIVAFIVAMPMAVIAYLAAVFLIPARSSVSGDRYGRQAEERTGRVRKCGRRERRRARKAARREQEREHDTAPSIAAAEIRQKCQTLDERIVELEKIITSSSYQLDREIRSL